jgi:Etoposide-induced protein 2.4 (EI24)
MSFEQGILYFVTHRFLWTFLRARLIPIILLSAFIYVNLFLWTYLPQVAVLHFFHGPVAWLNAAVLVLGEGQVIIALLFEAFLVDETLVDIFDSVLINEGFQDLIGQARVLYTDADNPAKMLGKPTKSAIYSPFSLRQIIEFIVFLPINLIPFVGVPIFLIITGYRAGPLHHWRYFKLLGLSKKERKQYIQRRKMKYTWFGTVALMLQLVPVLSMFFLLTSAAGSALWIVKMEKARRTRERVSAPEDPYHEEPV